MSGYLCSSIASSPLNVFPEEIFLIVKLPTHHDQYLYPRCQGVVESSVVRQKNVKGKSETNLKKSNSHMCWKLSVIASLISSVDIYRGILDIFTLVSANCDWKEQFFTELLVLADTIFHMKHMKLVNRTLPRTVA
jgi:hypothetical protein